MRRRRGRGRAARASSPAPTGSARLRRALRRARASGAASRPPTSSARRHPPRARRVPAAHRGAHAAAPSSTSATPGTPPAPPRGGSPPRPATRRPSAARSPGVPDHAARAATCGRSPASARTTWSCCRAAGRATLAEVLRAQVGAAASAARCGNIRPGRGRHADDDSTRCRRTASLPVLPLHDVCLFPGASLDARRRPARGARRPCSMAERTGGTAARPRPPRGARPARATCTRSAPSPSSGQSQALSPARAPRRARRRLAAPASSTLVGVDVLVAEVGPARRRATRATSGAPPSRRSPATSTPTPTCARSSSAQRRSSDADGLGEPRLPAPADHRLGPPEAPRVERPRALPQDQPRPRRAAAQERSSQVGLEAAARLRLARAAPLHSSTTRTNEPSVRRSVSGAAPVARAEAQRVELRPVVAERPRAAPRTRSRCVLSGGRTSALAVPARAARSRCRPRARR